MTSLYPSTASTDLARPVCAYRERRRCNQSRILAKASPVTDPTPNLGPIAPPDEGRDNVIGEPWIRSRTHFPPVQELSPRSWRGPRRPLGGREDCAPTRPAGRPAKSLLLVGLRGVGKTVLLDRIRSDAEVWGIHTGQIEAPEGRSLPSMPVPDLRHSLLRLSRSERAKESAFRALRALAGFAKALRAKFDDIEVGLDLEPEQGLADNGDLELDLLALLEATGDLRRSPAGHRSQTTPRVTPLALSTDAGSSRQVGRAPSSRRAPRRSEAAILRRASVSPRCRRISQRSSRSEDISQGRNYPWPPRRDPL